MMSRREEREFTRTAAGSLALVANSVLEIGAGFVLSLLLARTLGIGDFGVFNFALSWAAILTMTADAGLTLYAGKHVAESGRRWPAAFGGLMRLKLALNAAALPVLMMLSLLHPAVREHPGLMIAILLGEALRGVSVFVCFAFRGLRRAALELPVLGGERLLLLAGGAAALLLGGGLEALAAVFVGARLAALGLAWRLITGLRRAANAGPARTAWPAWSHLRRSGRLGLYLIGDRLLIQGTTVLLMYASSAQDTGVFQAAYKIVMIPAVLSAALAGSMIGPLAAARRDSPARFAALAGSVIRLNTLVMLVAATGVLLWAPRVIGWIYGPGWDGAVPVLRMLTLHFAGFGLNHPALFSLMALDAERFLGLSLLGAAGAAAAVNLAILPSAGATGAAGVLAAATWLLNGLFAARLARSGVRPGHGRLAATGGIVLALGWAAGRAIDAHDLFTEVPLPVLLALTGSLALALVWVGALTPADRGLLRKAAARLTGRTPP